MDIKTKRAKLLSSLYRERNGAVVDSMRSMGLVYGVSYGVSMVDIRRIAAALGTDHNLALEIYPEDIRELRLAAFLLADPSAVGIDEAPFWASGITTTELAAAAAAGLFSKSPSAGAFARLWIASGEPLLRYAALMTEAGRIARVSARHGTEPNRETDAKMAAESAAQCSGVTIGEVGEQSAERGAMDDVRTKGNIDRVSPDFGAAQTTPKRESPTSGGATGDDTTTCAPCGDTPSGTLDPFAVESTGRDRTREDWSAFFGLLRETAITDTDPKYLREGMAAYLVRLAGGEAGSHGAINGFISELRTAAPDLARYLDSEVMWAVNSHV